jgi:exodeoxyribonuclease V alpha subunit
MTMVQEYFTRAQKGKRVALVTVANSDAQAINEAIQQQRVDRGDLDPARVALGQGEQRLLEGDIVQTRRNDRAAGVDNRAVWTIGRIGADSIRLVSITDSGDTRDVSMAYAAEHMHLAYASTVHGVQGETTDAAIVGPGVDAAGLYVGMTRGRHDNYAIAIARTQEEAVGAIADAMGRGAQEVTIEEGQAAARFELGRAAVAPTSSLSTPGRQPMPTPTRSGPSR